MTDLKPLYMGLTPFQAVIATIEACAKLCEERAGREGTLGRVIAVTECKDALLAMIPATVRAFEGDAE